jgi:flagellar basal-body rod protein FlgB
MPTVHWADTRTMAGLSSRNELLGTALRFAELEHGVISQNIANANTPNYRTRELSFDEFLDAARHANPDSQPDGDVEVRLTEGLATRADGNNVDLDREMGRLKQNAMLFKTLSQLLMSQMDVMRRAMSR